MDEDAVREVLAGIEDPDLGDDIVSLGLVGDVTVAGDEVTVEVALEAPGSPVEAELSDSIVETLEAEGLSVTLTTADDDTDDDAIGVESLGPDAEGDAEPLPGVTNVIAVTSGKGGVGKSTISVNLAAGLAAQGADVALFDADMYGPNVPRMLGSTGQPRATEDEKIIPPEAYGMKLMSIGLMVGEDDPVIWRGALVHNTITQLIDDVEWGELDYMVVDFPPGTGDTQLTFLQSVPITGSVIVTTPQEVAIDDARRGLQMFARHDTPVLGIVENMSTFVCPDCGSEHDIFGAGGGESFAADNEMPFLGAIPLDPSIRTGGDEGKPIVLDDDSETGQAFRDMVAETADMVGILNRQQHSQ
ncbi:Mrp family protein, ATPase, contains iron-sulfurcluster [Halanaeroarchaeum sp. HSR-CO]|uniref:Mrp/NBP35 family ATP-binding protein n=1 Tax=Halanaeroarchaeum sp. HSR-CO TaxID=2866382 RepID=UPI00217E293C|nr:Mrp/NBP35 family ATP-binding protein [Halanaeroarchaeum sp. HSR-CO]UWG48253.1 Mrp family protein, ATPase, contains iron-sulfurcluster [Halanaeroarchaeum sp. HSR-CO]